MSENDELRRVLRELLTLLSDAERCATCEGPTVSFDEVCKHHTKWKEVSAKAEKILALGKRKPN
jgi:hypothetical protein